MDRKSQLLAFLQESPDDPFLNYALATEYVSEGNDEAAAVIFEKLITEQPSYVATYYHLGKLMERRGEKQAAMDIYRKGMEQAKLAGERHSLSELQSALLELEYD